MDFADLIDIKNVKVVFRVHHDKSCFSLGEHQLFRMSDKNYFAINSQFKGAKWTFVQSRFQIGQFHRVE